MSVSQQFLFSNDPYEKFIKDETRSKNLIANDRSSKFSRKFKAYKDQLLVKKTYFIYGGMQGFAIGCLAGFGIGVISAFQARRFIVIPLSMLASGTFFACVMAFGSLIRSADHDFMKKQSHQLTQKNFAEQYFLAQYVQNYQTALINNRTQNLV